MGPHPQHPRVHEGGSSRHPTAETVQVRFRRRPRKAVKVVYLPYGAVSLWQFRPPGRCERKSEEGRRHESQFFRFPDHGNLACQRILANS